jgi:hypothetical protein
MTSSKILLLLVTMELNFLLLDADASVDNGMQVSFFSLKMLLSVLFWNNSERQELERCIGYVRAYWFSVLPTAAVCRAVLSPLSLPLALVLLLRGTYVLWLKQKTDVSTIQLGNVWLE